MHSQQYRLVLACTTPTVAMIKILKIILSLLPWLLSMYGFYWLDSNLWDASTPHRGKLSVLLMGSGMALSFLMYSRLLARPSQR